jgi:hypothetical protein
MINLVLKTLLEDGTGEEEIVTNLTQMSILEEK